MLYMPSLVRNESMNFRLGDRRVRIHTVRVVHVLAFGPIVFDYQDEYSELLVFELVAMNASLRSAETKNRLHSISASSAAIPERERNARRVGASTLLRSRNLRTR